MNCRTPLPGLFAFVLAAAVPGLLGSQVPPLPEGARTRWEIKGVKEIVIWVLFEPALVTDRLPQGLRFVTLEELATKLPPGTTTGREVRAYLAAHPEHEQLAVSFVEVSRVQYFAIDGRTPALPENGAFGMWFAPVTSPGLENDSARGGEVLMLLVLLPDSAYAQYMREKGHYAEYGDARLWKDESNTWRGTIETTGLRVEGACTPMGEEKAEDPGYQTLYPPGQAVKQFLVVSTFEYRFRECPGTWSFSGTHPLARGVVLGLGVFPTGGLLGGAYDFPSQR